MDPQNSSPLETRNAELAAQNSAQPQLFEGLPDAQKVMENRREYTGAQLLERKPLVYEAIVRALGEGLGIRQTARACGVSHHTVIAVRDAEPDLVATHKKETARKLRTLATLSAERLTDEIDKVPLQTLPIVIGVAIDKAQLLDGEATQRVETVKGPTHEDYARIIAEAEAAANRGAIEVEAIPVTGLCGENLPTNGEPISSPKTLASDMEALAIDSQVIDVKEDTKSATSLATSERLDSDSSQGGGGDRAAKPGG